MDESDKRLQELDNDLRFLAGRNAANAQVHAPAPATEPDGDDLDDDLMDMLYNDSLGG